MNDRADSLTRLLDLREQINQLFEAWVSSPEVITAHGAWLPVADLVETENGYTLVLDLPGVDPGAVGVEATERVVTVFGERPYPAAADDVVHRIERGYGRFVRQVELPRPIELARIEKLYADGVFIVSLMTA